jgi:hypothetical protein
MGGMCGRAKALVGVAVVRQMVVSFQGIPAFIIADMQPRVVPAGTEAGTTRRRGMQPPFADAAPVRIGNGAA